jgi:hypothetical protein
MEQSTTGLADSRSTIEKIPLLLVNPMVQSIPVFTKTCHAPLASLFNLLLLSGQGRENLPPYLPNTLKILYV